MDDNLSTKSSESSITTSGEYEIVTDSNVASPTEPVNRRVISQELKTPPEEVKKPPTSLSALALSSPEGGGDRSPTLDMAHNRNLSDMEHEMTDALRDLELERGVGEYNRAK